MKWPVAMFTLGVESFSIITVNEAFGCRPACRLVESEDFCSVRVRVKVTKDDASKLTIIHNLFREI